MFLLQIESVTMVTATIFKPITTKRSIYVISISKTNHTTSVSIRTNRLLRFQITKCLWQSPSILVSVNIHVPKGARVWLLYLSLGYYVLEMCHITSTHLIHHL